MLNYEIPKEILDSEKITRKRSAGFIKKLITVLGYEVDYNQYKSLIYAERSPNNIEEKYIKAVYDSYIYLISNCKTPLDETVLNKFLYVMKKEEFNSDEILKIQTAFYYPSDKNIIERLAKFCFEIYEILFRRTIDERVLISLILCNYLLLSENYLSVQIGKKDLKNYLCLIEKYKLGQHKGLQDYFYRIITNQDIQSYEYYQNLKNINSDMVIKMFNREKEQIKEKYKIEKMYLFGSIAQDATRFDSDIDIYLQYEEGLTKTEKNQYKEGFVEEYKRKFNRNIDVQEDGRFINKDLITIVKTMIKIF